MWQSRLNGGKCLKEVYIADYTGRVRVYSKVLSISIGGADGLSYVYWSKLSLEICGCAHIPLKRRIEQTLF